MLKEIAQLYVGNLHGVITRVGPHVVYNGREIAGIPFTATVKQTEEVLRKHETIDGYLGDKVTDTDRPDLVEKAKTIYPQGIENVHVVYNLYSSMPSHFVAINGYTKDYPSFREIK